MQTKKSVVLFSIPALLLAFSASAHDPDKHLEEKDAKRDANCHAMKDMDHSKMDMSDPVMQGMMQKCMAKMHDGDKMKAPDATHHDTQQPTQQ